MRNAFLLFACLGSVVLAHAQTSSPAAAVNLITVTVSNNSMSVSYKSKEVIVHSNPELDSCLQKIIPGLYHPSILLDAPNDIDRERLRTIGAILGKFHCPVMSFQKADIVKPTTSLRMDTAGH